MEEVKTLAGIMQVLEVTDSHLKLQVGNVKPTAWADSCTTSFEDIKSLANKNVVAEYVERENKKFPNNPHKNVIKVWLNAEVAPALNGPPTDNTMSKKDWDLKDWRIHRSALAKTAMMTGYFKSPDEAIAWVYEMPQIPATKPQEGKPSKSWTKEQVAQIAQDVHGPSIATADKPAVAAAQGVPISQLPVEQILAELWPHLWRTHKITKSKVAELKGWMTNALKDSGFPVPETLDKAKPEQIYAMGEYARREAQGATK